jgi:hypothetical protein
MAYGQGQQTAALTAPPDSITGRLTSLSKLINDLSEVADTAERIANQLGGAQPGAPISATGPAAVPNGMGERLGDLLASLEANIARVRHAANRSETALG